MGIFGEVIKWNSEGGTARLRLESPTIGGGKKDFVQPHIPLKSKLKKVPIAATETVKKQQKHEKLGSYTYQRVLGGRRAVKCAWRKGQEASLADLGENYKYTSKHT